MTPGTTVLSPGAALINPAPNAVNQVFDYASFLWDGSDAWRPVSDPGSTVNFEPQVMVSSTKTHSEVSHLLNAIRPRGSMASSYLLLLIPPRACR